MDVGSARHRSCLAYTSVARRRVPVCLGDLVRADMTDILLHSVSTLQVTGPSFPRFVDHDDKVSEVRLGDAYDLTARAWMARYKVPYSQCGCHQGDLSSIDGGLSAAIPDKLKFWNKGESKTDQRRRAIEKVIQGECVVLV